MTATLVRHSGPVQTSRIRPGRSRIYGAWVIAALLGIPIGVHGAQSADALIDKLVEKGILTTKEGKELREQDARDSAQPRPDRAGMPDWLTALKFNGDLRGRFEGFYGGNQEFADRNRFRYRLRFGATAAFKEDFEAGLRLTSSEAAGTLGGDPISGNTTFADNGSKKFVYLDLAYAKWSPLHTADWRGGLTIGKMENPFVFPSTIMFDHDYTPEGAAAQVSYALSEKHQLLGNFGVFMLDELSASSHDPFLLGAQVRWNAEWTEKLTTTAGVAGFSISNTERLSNSAVPNIGRGNTRDSNGAPARNFNPLYADAGITYKLDKFPIYKGAFPITASADYLNNPAAPRQNEGFSAGLTLGKAGKRGHWEISYRWVELQRDAWWEELPESDFGAYYQAQQGNAGFDSASNLSGAGYGSGTNVRGHIARAAYSPYDFFTLGVSCFVTGLIEESPPKSESGITRVQVDANWKF